MQATISDGVPRAVSTTRCARCIEASRRVRWDIDGDVIRGRRFKAVDGGAQVQADADAEYFLANAGRRLDVAEQQAIRDGMLKAYRCQYIASGMQEPRFRNALADPATPAPMERIGAALAPLLAHAAH